LTELFVVSRRVKRIFLELGFHDHVQAVVFAYEAGLVFPGESPAETNADRSTATPE